MNVLLLLVFTMIADLPEPGLAEDAFRAGRYEEALSLYRSALSEEDPSRGAVLYNMGNCAFRLGRYSEAALFYRRAHLRLPRDGETAFNLALAEQRLGMNRHADRSFGAAFLETIDSFPPGELLLLVTWLEAAGLIGLVLLRRRRAVRLVMIALVMLALAGAALIVEREWLDDSIEGVVLAREIELRSRPHGDIPADLDLKAGELVRVKEMSDRWIRVDHARGGGWTELSGVGLVD